MRNARKIGGRTPRSQYTTYPPSRRAPARYTARGKTISRRGASTGDVLQRLTMRCAGHRFHHTTPRPDSAPVDHQRPDAAAQGPACLVIDASDRLTQGAQRGKVAFLWHTFVDHLQADHRPRWYAEERA